MVNYIKYDHLAPRYQTYLSGMSEVAEPYTYDKVIEDPRWMETIKWEIEALQINHIRNLVLLPSRKKQKE